MQRSVEHIKVYTFVRFARESAQEVATIMYFVKTDPMKAILHFKV